MRFEPALFPILAAIAACDVDVKVPTPNTPTDTDRHHRHQRHHRHDQHDGTDRRTDRRPNRHCRTSSSLPSPGRLVRPQARLRRRQPRRLRRLRGDLRPVSRRSTARGGLPGLRSGLARRRRDRRRRLRRHRLARARTRHWHRSKASTAMVADPRVGALRHRRGRGHGLRGQPRHLPGRSRHGRDDRDRLVGVGRRPRSFSARGSGADLLAGGDPVPFGGGLVGRSRADQISLALVQPPPTAGRARGRATRARDRRRGRRPCG